MNEKKIIFDRVFHQKKDLNNSNNINVLNNDTLSYKDNKSNSKIPFNYVKKGLIVFIILFIALLPDVKADILPTFSYNETTKTYSLYSWLGLNHIADIQLISNTDECLIDCSAEFLIIPNDNINITNPNDWNIKFFDKQAKEFSIGNQLKDYKLSKKVIESYQEQVDDWGICNGTRNIINNLTNENIVENYNYSCIIGNHIETKQREVWRDFMFNSTSFRRNESVYIRLEGKKSPTASIDWQPKIAGIRLDKWAWWNSEWTRKKAINITEQAGYYTLRNYTMVFNVIYDSDMQPDFDDIRFINDSETAELNYFRESYVASSSAVFYVLLNQNLTVNSSLNIYMYYGNPSASTTSNINKAFLFYDDFSTNHISDYYNFGGTWDMNSGGNGLLRQTNGATAATNIGHRFWNTTLEGLEVTAGYSSPDHDNYWSPTGIKNASLLGLDMGSDGTNFQHWVSPSSRDCILYPCLGQVTPTAVNDANYHNDTMRVFFKNSTLGNWTGIIDGSFRTAVQDSQSPPIGRMDKDQIKTYMVSVTATQINVDYVRIREYVFPEPSYSFGLEQSLSFDSNHPIFNININTTNVLFNNSKVNISVTFTNLDSTGLTNITNWYENNQSMLVLNMPFDTNGSDVFDYSGFGNNGTIIGANQNTTWSFGADCKGLGGCYNFQVGGTISNFTGINITREFSRINNLSDNFSIELWFKTNNVNLRQHLYRKEVPAIFDLEVSSGNTLTANFIGLTDNVVNSQSNLIKANNWYHVVVMKNSTAISLFINGTLNNADLSTGLNTWAIGNIWLGNGDDIPNGFFPLNGSIAEFRIWNRTLSPQQIYQNYLAGINNRTIDTLVNTETTLGRTYKVAGYVANASSIGMNINTSEVLIQQAPPTTPTLNLPIDNLMTANYTINMSAFGSIDDEGDTINYEFYLERETNPPTILYGNTTIQSNVTSLGADGRYFWRVRVNDNQSVSGFTSTRSFLVDRRLITENLTVVNPNATLSSTQIYSLNITFNQSTVYDVDANFIYAGTRYEVTKTNLSDNKRSFVRTLNPPSGINNWNWNLTITQLNNTLVYNTSFSGQQTVDDFIFAACNSTLTKKYLNLTFKDETTNERINGTIDSSTMDYFVDVEADKKTLSYINTTKNLEYVFCASPSYTNYNLKIKSFVYGNSPNYQTRTWLENIIITNGTTNKTLFLLSSSSGSYVTFQVVSQGNQPIQDVLVTASRNNVIIQSGLTDAAGLVTFFLNPNLPYDFSFSKSGYSTFTSTFQPTQSAYTITLSATIIVSDINPNIGINYTIFPLNTTLNKSTTYIFGFNIQSDGYFQLSEYGFLLRNNTAILTNTIKGSNPLGSFISTTYNTGNNSRIIMDYYWTVNQTNMTGSHSWNVFNLYVGTASVQNFCNHLTNFGNTFQSTFGGEEGFAFTKAIIAFILIMIITVGVTYASGIYTPVGVVGIIAFSTAFLDFCGNLIPTPINALPHFITFLIGVIFIALLIDSINQR